MLHVSVYRALIWWEPFCTTSKDTAVPQNLWLMSPALIYFVRTYVYDEICLTLKTPLFLLMKFALNAHRQSMTSGLVLGEHGKCCIVMFGHSLLWAYFVLLLQCDKLPSPHFLQAFLRAWIYQRPSNIELKDSQVISQMAGNTVQKQYLTLFLGAEAIGNSWICQFDLPSTCTYCVVNLKRPDVYYLQSVSPLCNR